MFTSFCSFSLCLVVTSSELSTVLGQGFRGEQDKTLSSRSGVRKMWMARKRGIGSEDRWQREEWNSIAKAVISVNTR